MMKTQPTTNQRQQRIIDLRSDVVALPTDAMWQAMREATLGWASVGEDISVNRLEALAANRTGKEAALYVPTGTMANLVALMTHTRGGDQIILEASSHILWSEEWSFASICGVVPRSIRGTQGVLDPEQVREAILEKRFSHRPYTSLICLENTHNMAGGTVLSPTQIQATAAIAVEYGAALHLDGARIFNASVALGKPVHELTVDVDTVTMSLNKGLSAPGGALLCGSGTFVEQSRLNLKRLGGASMHKAGLYAAAGLVALQTMIPLLSNDHRRAHLLARGLSEFDGIRVDLDTVQSNIVMASIDEAVLSAEALLRRMEEHGVKATLCSSNVIRFVTHRDVTDEAICQVIHVVRDTVSKLKDDLISRRRKGTLL